MKLTQRTLDQVVSPITEAYDLLPMRHAKGHLLDLAQAAPPYPPADQVLDHVTHIARTPTGAGYTEVPGLPHLRSAFAYELETDYAASTISADHVVITAGCNQAFTLVMSALTEPGDEVIMLTPYYFNHDMWLKLTGIRPVYLNSHDNCGPRCADAERLISTRTRAILLVTPGNPTGITLDPGTIAEFASLARRHDLVLVLDETYRSFRSSDQPPHQLFATPDWEQHVVSLHSFSKDLAIPGYRVGAVVASLTLGREVCKLLDCVAVCAPRIGQEAAWAGLTYAQEWRDERRRQMAAARAQFIKVMAERPGGFEIESCGAFFAWVRHPFPERATADVVRNLVVEHNVLVVPGTAFAPEDPHAVRMSVSNLDSSAASLLVDRLRDAGRVTSSSID